MKFPISSCAILAGAVCLSLATMPRLEAATPPEAAMPNNQTEPRHYGSPAERQRRLNMLFSKLKAVKTQNVADSIVNQIWITWHESGRRDIDDKLTLAKIYAGEGELEAALTALDEIVALMPQFAEGWNRRATVLYQMGRFNRSLADISETLKREPRHFGALAGRGLILAAQEKYRAALKAFDEAIKHNPFVSERMRIIPAIKEKLGEVEL